jgi:hypothetical protein
MTWTWKDQSRAVELIKSKCFDSGEVNPRRLNKSTVQDAKNRHRESFVSMNSEDFLSAFKRAASEWILENDLQSSRKKNVKGSQVLDNEQPKDLLLKPTTTVSHFTIPHYRLIDFFC